MSRGMSYQREEFVACSRERFFALLDGLPVLPWPDRRETLWRNQATGRVVGITAPGYMVVGPKVYLVHRSLSGEQP